MVFILTVIPNLTLAHIHLYENLVEARDLPDDIKDELLIRSLDLLDDEDQVSGKTAGIMRRAYYCAECLNEIGNDAVEGEVCQACLDGYLGTMPVQGDSMQGQPESGSYGDPGAVGPTGAQNHLGFSYGNPAGASRVGHPGPVTASPARQHLENSGANSQLQRAISFHANGGSNKVVPESVLQAKREHARLYYANLKQNKGENRAKPLLGTDPRERAAYAAAREKEARAKAKADSERRAEADRAQKAKLEPRAKAKKAAYERNNERRRLARKQAREKKTREDSEQRARDLAQEQEEADSQKRAREDQAQKKKLEAKDKKNERRRLARKQAQIIKKQKACHAIKCKLPATKGEFCDDHQRGTCLFPQQPRCLRMKYRGLSRCRGHDTESEPLTKEELTYMITLTACPSKSEGCFWGCRCDNWNGKEKEPVNYLTYPSA